LVTATTAAAAATELHCTCTLLRLCAATIPQSHFSGHLWRPPGQWHLLPLPFLPGIYLFIYLFIFGFPSSDRLGSLPVVNVPNLVLR
jgi:hypothetical protein